MEGTAVLEFGKIAQYLGNELVLAGFALFLVVGLMRLALGLKIFRKLTTELTHALLMRLLTYGFILALCGLAGGFGLAAYRASIENNHNNGTHTSTNRIEPLDNPSRLDTPSQNVATPHVVRILEGNSPSMQRRLFDITIENPLNQQIMFDNWEVEWRYFGGSLAAISHAAVIQPVTEHAIKLTIDPENSELNKRSIPISPDIVLPAASRESPSIHKFRLELIYAFTSPDMQHAASDWDIVFSVSIRTTNGHLIPLFIDQGWRT